MQFRDFGLKESLLAPMLSSQGDLEHARSALSWFARGLMTRRKMFHARFPAGDTVKNKNRSFVVVHGDTLSTFIGAWLGRRAGLAVVHIEAGLRSGGGLFHPFPEEITRRLVSRLAEWHMAPDMRAEENLRRARVSGQIVCTQGNTLMDAVQRVAPLADAAATAPQIPFALANVHRFENLNSPTRWKKIVETVCKAAAHRKVIFVMHPQTRQRLRSDTDARERFEAVGVELRDRMPFTGFISLLKRAEFLISDGGSNQEECSYIGKPCLILRQSSERQEGLDTCCVLSRFHDRLIDSFLANPEAYERTPLFHAVSPSQKILEALEFHADSPLTDVAER
ncbi:MAG: UDP-N-acetylglucosamine 2-epimerase [Bdellovibrionales bacterium]